MNMDGQNEAAGRGESAGGEECAFQPYSQPVNRAQHLLYYDLLRVFTERPNRVLSRDDLVDSLKGFERDPFDRSIDIRVTRLRRKIETDPGAPAYVRTVRGEGYLFNPLGEKS